MSYLENQPDTLQVTWLDDRRWQVTLPLHGGANEIHLVALDRRGVQVGQDAVVVTTTVP